MLPFFESKAICESNLKTQSQKKENQDNIERDRLSKVLQLACNSPSPTYSSLCLPRFLAINLLYLGPCTRLIVRIPLALVPELEALL